MTLNIETRPVPLTENAHGIFMVSGTRVPLDTVVYAFRNGDTAEEIVESFDTLDLADVYAVISFYLDNQEQVEDYLRRREAEAKAFQHEMETRFPPFGLRERLMARRKNRAQAGG
mgnify:CR=1 FL=1